MISECLARRVACVRAPLAGRFTEGSSSPIESIGTAHYSGALETICRFTAQEFKSNSEAWSRSHGDSNPSPNGVCALQGRVRWRNEVRFPAFVDKSAVKVC